MDEKECILDIARAIGERILIKEFHKIKGDS